MKKEETTTTPSLSNYDGDATALVEMMDRKIAASKSHWNGKKYKLETVTTNNEELYLGTNADVRAEDGEDVANDNRIFSSVRTIVPYVTSRITEPEVYPSSKSQSAKRFAEDFEKAIYIKAKIEKVKEKTKFALEDAVIRRRGYLKPRYDAATRNFCAIDYVPCESIIVDHKAKPFEEPRYFRHLLDKSIEDLLIMFPDKEEDIYTAFSLTKETATPEKLEEEHTIHEDWTFVRGKEGLDLVVCWSYKKIPFGCIKDPNWNYEGDNFLDTHKMPLVFFNVLSDGRSLVDKTSFVEQAKYLQNTVNEREEQISKNAGIGSVGMPVVAADALADEQAENLTFDPETVLILDTGESGSLRDKFDVWKAETLPQAVYESKVDARNSIDNAFGTPNVFRGEQSKNNTLGQDVLVRDQAFGRQQEIVDAIDNAMERLYPFIAQFLLVYGEEEEQFELNGEDSEFDYVMLNTEELDTKVKIQIRGGTSMPIDRAQRRATADNAAKHAMIDPLTYWEVMDERNARKYAKRVTQYTNDPANYLKDEDSEAFNRDAFVDLQKIKRGQAPEFREDLPKEYFDYLNQYVLSGDLENPEIAPDIKQALTSFIDMQLARGQKMLGMAETQLPTPEEVTAVNQETDQLNQQEQAAAQTDAKVRQMAARTAAQAQPAPAIA
jgi:hypothetical protein